MAVPRAKSVNFEPRHDDADVEHPRGAGAAIENSSAHCVILLLPRRPVALTPTLLRCPLLLDRPAILRNPRRPSG